MAWTWKLWMVISQKWYFGHTNSKYILLSHFPAEWLQILREHSSICIQWENEKNNWPTHPSGRFCSVRSHLSCNVFLIYHFVVFRMLQKWSKTRWTKNLELPGMQSLEKDMDLKLHMKLKTYSICSLVEIWQLLFGNAHEHL